MFCAPVSVAVGPAGHDRRNPGGQPGLSAPAGRKRLLPLQLSAAAEGQTMDISDQLLVKFTIFMTLEMVPVAVVAGRPEPLTHLSVSCEATVRRHVDACEDVSDQQNVESKHACKQRPALLLLSGGKLLSGCWNAGRETRWCDESPYLNLRESLWQHQEMASKLRAEQQ